MHSRVEIFFLWLWELYSATAELPVGIMIVITHRVVEKVHFLKLESSR